MISKNLCQTVYGKLAELSDCPHYLLGYSGGLDSHVLLHVLTQLRQEHPEINLRVAHVHHGLSQQADAWAARCERVCHDWSIPFFLRFIHPAALSGQGLEAAARTLRYRAFSELLEPNECLLTAHTEDDQAETLLLQLLRGAGPKGLSAMPEAKPLGATRHLRPLLKVARSMLETYATAETLSWIEDDTNADLRFDRNYLRACVIPTLKARWPATNRSLARSAAHCADSTNLLSDLAKLDYEQLQGADTNNNTLHIPSLMRLPTARRYQVLRYWLSRQNYAPPNERQLLQLERNVLQSRSDAMPIWPIESDTVRRYRDQLFVVKSRNIDSSLILPWDGRSKLQLPSDLGAIHPAQFSAFIRTDSVLSIRFRQGGERIKPAGHAHTRSLKKLFQQWKVPPWERNHIPLLFSDECLVAVIGYCRVAV